MQFLTKKIIAFLAVAQGSNRFSSCVHCFSVGNNMGLSTTIISTRSIQSADSCFLSMSTNKDSNLSNDIDYSEEPTISKSKSKRRSSPKSSKLQRRKRKWIAESIDYYSKVSRDAKRRQNGQFVPSELKLNQHKSTFATAKKLYYARHKIKRNQFRHAERIYRKLIDDLLLEQELGESCGHAQIAISTLLLALLLQRQGDIKETRATFIRFFRLITVDNYQNGELKECTCSAKVLQAFALFEMKQGNPRKAYNLVQMAVRLDSELEPVLQWKQFRDAKELIRR